MKIPSRLDGPTIAGWLTVFAPIAIALGNVASEVAVVALVAVFLVHSAQQRDFAWVRRPWIAIALCLWAFGVLRNGLLDTSWPSFGFSLAWVRFIVFAAALAEWVLPQDIWRQRMVLSGTAAVGFMAADALLQFVIGHDIIGRPIAVNRLTAEFPRPMVGIEIAWMFLPVLMGLLAGGRRIGALVFGLLCAAAVLLSGERFALLLTVAYACCAALYVAPLRRAAFWILPAATIVLAGLYVLVPKTFDRQISSTADAIANYSSTHYGIITANALRMAADRPLLGVGLPRYRDACPDPKFGPEFVGPSHLPRCTTHPQNIYLEWLTETGAIGFGLFVALVSAILLRLWQGLRQPPADLVLFGLATTIALRVWPLASTTSFFIAWSAVPFWLLIGWAMALAGRRVYSTPATA